jgi:uncharacterized membrane protein
MKRLPEVDALRGLAIVLMVAYHFNFDLHWLNLADVDPFGPFWTVEGNITRYLFLGLVGVSIALSNKGFSDQLKRGLKIFAWGMVVSIVTWFAVGENFVFFGILHLIGVAVPIVSLFKNRPFPAIVVALLALMFAQVFSSIEVQSIWLSPLGFNKIGSNPLDYFPIFPWIATPLVGLVIGEFLYRDREPTFLAVINKIPGLRFLGKNALFIYLVHQPLLIGVLSLI